MRKFVIPVLLFIAVFLVSWLCQAFTLICQEYEGLFLATPDAWARAFTQPFPLSGIVSDFIVQFYRDPVYGALFTALIVTGVFLLLRGVLSRLVPFTDALSALGAGVLWVFLARASEPKPGVAALLIGLVVWGVYRVGRRFLGCARNDRKGARNDSCHPERPCHPERSRGIPVAAVLVLAAAAWTVFSPAVQRTERFSRVKRDALYGVWDDLLKTVPPSVAEADGELTPFALLALSGKGQLGDRLFSYPVYSENDLDMVDYDGPTEYYTSLLFKATLYQHLGCYNEAVHNYCQWATQLRKGTSFIVLRKLVEMYCLLGDYVLMEKYCRVLDRSLLNRAYVRHYRALAARGEARGTEPASVRSRIPVISHDPLYNLLMLEASGIHSESAVDRTLATLLLRGNEAQLRSGLEQMAPSYEHIPRHFQEAMMVLGIRSGAVDESLIERYSVFQMDLQRLPEEELVKRYRNTAFLYLQYVL